MEIRDDKLLLSEDDLLTILEMRDSIYYTTFEEKLTYDELAELCSFTYYIVTDKNARYSHYVRKFCKKIGLKYDGETGLVTFLKKNYNIDIIVDD